MNLLDTITNPLKKVATTHGGEYAGPCPSCGGQDRFRVWPNEGPTGRFWCRSCGKHGDGIQYIRDNDGLSYLEACTCLGVMPSLSWKPGLPTRQTSTIWQPREPIAPGITWQEKASAFVEKSKLALLGPAGADGRAFLADRGFKPETIKSAGLGWNAREMFIDRVAWGLVPETNDQGKQRRIWLPVGLVIPCFEQGRVIRLKIRRSNPGEGSRYVFVAGSSSVPMTWSLDKKTLVVVESELDGLLLRQEAGDLIGVVALGSAQVRPDRETHSLLNEAELILFSLDWDKTGRDQFLWWSRNYKNVVPWPTSSGKDPSEAFQNGLSIRTWILAGIKRLKITKPNNKADIPQSKNCSPLSTQENSFEIRPFPEAWLKKFDETELERIAIMTVDGSLSDEEALKRILL